MQRSLIGVVLTSCLLASCELARPFTSEAKFATAGGALQPKRLPDPDPEKVNLQGLSVRIDSSIAEDDPEFFQQFVAKLREASAGRYKSMRGSDKKWHYEIAITEMNEQNGFSASKVGAVAGAISGGVAGSQIARRGRRTTGTVVGAGVGAAAGAVLFGEKKNTWAFQVVFRQRTSAEGRSSFNDSDTTDTSGVGGVSGTDNPVDTSGAEVLKQTQRITFNTTTNVAQQSRYFTITAKSGVFHGESARKNRIREEMLKRVPSWLMGGRRLDF